MPKKIVPQELNKDTSEYHNLLNNGIVSNKRTIIIDKKIKYSEKVLPDEYQELCRTCLDKNGLINIFEDKHNEITFCNLLAMFSLLQADSADNLPKTICDDCSKILIQFYTFKECIKKSHDILLDIQNRVENHKSLENNDEPSLNNENGNDENSESDTDKEQIETNKGNSYNITCPFCQLNFSSYATFLKHRREEADLRRKKKLCSICDKFIIAYKLKDHLNSHTRQAPYECDQCGEKYRFRSSLTRHKFVHKEKKPHVCHICGRGFIQAPTLTDHIRTHTSEKIFICNICGKRFITKHALSNHLYTHKNPTDELSCKNCNKTFISMQSLKQHAIIHLQKEFLCSQCGKKFSTKSLLNCHQKSHSEVKPHVCDICGKGFADRKSLVKHGFVHNGCKPHVCVMCDKKFSQKGHLTYHMRKHSGERPYSCSFCEKTFSHSGSYKVHIRIHTGERPYTCDVCNKGFYDSSGMKKHRKIHEVGNLNHNSSN